MTVIKSVTATLITLCVICGANSPDKDGLLSHSLQCYNDYTSYTVCTWRESVEAHRLRPMKLYRITFIDTRIDFECKQISPLENVSASVIGWSCLENSTNFVVGIKERYIFEPAVPIPVLRKSVNLSENVRPRPPRDLHANLSEEGDITLSWQTDYPPGNRLHGRLQYQISYKRAFQDWQSSELVLISEDVTRFVFGTSLLIAESEYEARVRARLQDNGKWSEWSPLVDWKTARAEDADPQNLQCDYDGLQEVICTWEVRRELAESLKSNLTYRDGPSGEEKVCSPEVVRSDPEEPVVFFQCKFPTTNFSEVQISVKPAEEHKEIIASHNIKLWPPTNVSVELVNKDHVLSWKAVALRYPSIQTKTEIRYKPAEDPWETALVVEALQGASSLSLSAVKLRPSTRYTAEVRMTTIPKNCPWCYKGPWSDWSQEVSWETQADSMVPAYLIVLLCSIAVPVMLVYGCKIGKRLKNKWDVTIPSPLNSKVLADRQGAARGPLLFSQDSMENPCISKVQILECPLASRTEEKMMTEDGLYQQFAGRDFTVKGLVKALAYWPLNDQHSHTLAKESSPFHFSGPYIMCPRSSSLPDVILASGRDSEVNRGTNLGYVSTQPQSPHQSLSLIAGSLSGIPHKINGYVDASLLTGTSRAESEELNPEKGKADSSGYIPDMDLFQGPPNGFSLKPEVQCIGDLAFQDGYILGPLPDLDLPGKAVDLSGLDVGERVPEVMGSCEANQPSISLPNSIIQSHSIQPGGYAGEKDCLSQPDLPTMPLLMKQVGDYCFIPDPQGRDWGSSPPSGIYAPNPASCTSPEKGHPKQSKPVTNPYVVLDKTVRC